MKTRIFLAAIFVGAFAYADQRTIQLPDILAWKRIQTPVVSGDGVWLAYKLTPGEGNSEVVIRNLKTGKEQHFPIGELPRAAGPVGGGRGGAPAAPRDLAISEDSRWAAFLVYPSDKEARALRRTHRPVESKLELIDLATGEKKEFDKVRRFAFSGELATAIAIHRYPPAPPAPPTPAAGTAPAQGGRGGGANNNNPERPQGSDLIVLDLASGTELNLGNVADFSFDKKGDRLAWIIDAQDKEGNGVAVRNMESGAVMALDSAKANYKGLTWTDKGDGLATLRGVDDKAWQDKLYTLVAFRNFSAPMPEKIVFDPAQDPSFPKDMTLSPNRNPYWMADLSAVAFGIHENRPKVKEDRDAPDDPDMTIWNWKDGRLPPMQQVQETRDKDFSYLCVYRPAEKKFLRLADESVRQVTANAEYKYAVGVDVRAYEREANLDGRRYEDVYAINLETGERKLALKKARWVQSTSPDGTHVLYYEDGAFYTFDMRTGDSYNITKDVPAVFYNTEDDHNVVKPPERPIGWSKDSMAVLLSDGWDIWAVPVHGGTGTNLTGNGKADKIRYRVRYRLDPDEKGIDLSEPLYIGAYGEWTKKGGIGVVEPGTHGIHMLCWEDAHYQAMEKAKRADVYLYTRETEKDFPDFYVTDAKLENPQRVTDANPQQKDFLWSSGVRLVDYTSDKGAKLQAALYLPANYQPGKSYPAIVYIYEKLSDQANHYPQPTFNGFNTAFYTSNGYAVLTPDIVYKVDDPGMSAVWCVLPALKAAIATGVVDGKRVGLHGGSWGGYQTAFLITQTNAFHAAFARAPLTDMIAMYNAIYWNTGSANQPIFESSQGRFSADPQDDMEAYQRNSPEYHAKNVNTPFVMMHNDKDGAVDWTQGIEYFNTLRRLGKPVVMLSYKGENHSLRIPVNMKDYTLRMKEFFDYELQDRQAPKWWTDGVPVLKMKDELDSRRKLLTSAAATSGSDQQ
ncbi:MAG TPA: prolyl oligopeptidase family serine peptidase [Bryobacteraceae bacterium]|nr:prolyl oligopeptidase family serine peptidase [Bryobacteraceae bacterium]